MFERVDILVPVYNNADTLRPLVDQVTHSLANTVSDLRFVFVDDASPDQASEVLTQINTGNFRIIRNARNIGQQASIKRGLAHCDGQAVVVMDADLQDPPSAVPDLLAALAQQRVDVVFATRVGTYQSRWRMLHSHLFRFAIRRLTNLPRGAGGFVAITQKVAMEMATAPPKRFYLAGFLGSRNYRIGAVPVERNHRHHGQSGYTGAMRLSLGFSNLLFVLNERIARAKK